MTQEQENDYKILFTLSLKKYYTKKELAIACWALGADSNLFVSNATNVKYIQIKDDPNAIFEGGKKHMPGNLDALSQFRLSLSGEIYLEWLKSEKEREQLDFDVKKATLTNNKFQRTVTYASLAVAILTGTGGIITPLLIHYLDKDKKIEIILPEMKQTLKSQQAIQQNIKEIQKTLQSKDTSIAIKK